MIAIEDNDDLDVCIFEFTETSQMDASITLAIQDKKTKISPKTRAPKVVLENLDGFEKVQKKKIEKAEESLLSADNSVLSEKVLSLLDSRIEEEVEKRINKMIEDKLSKSLTASTDLLFEKKEKEEQVVAEKITADETKITEYNVVQSEQKCGKWAGISSKIQRNVEKQARNQVIRQHRHEKKKQAKDLAENVMPCHRRSRKNSSEETKKPTEMGVVRLIHNITGNSGQNLKYLTEVKPTEYASFGKLYISDKKWNKTGLDMTHSITGENDWAYGFNRLTNPGVSKFNLEFTTPKEHTQNLYKLRVNCFAPWKFTDCRVKITIDNLLSVTNNVKGEDKGRTDIDVIFASSPEQKHNVQVEFNSGKGVLFMSHIEVFNAVNATQEAIEHKQKELVDLKSKAMTHFGIICDGCQMHPIVGTRFKCMQCPDYDLCMNCEPNHHKDHLMMRIPKPSNLKDVMNGNQARNIEFPLIAPVCNVLGPMTKVGCHKSRWGNPLFGIGRYSRCNRNMCSKPEEEKKVDPVISEKIEEKPEKPATFEIPNKEEWLFKSIASAFGFEGDYEPEKDVNFLGEMLTKFTKSDFVADIFKNLEVELKAAFTEETKEEEKQPEATEEKPKTEEIVTEEKPKTEEVVTEEEPKTEEVVADEEPKTEEIVADEEPKTEEVVADEKPVLNNEQEALVDQLYEIFEKLPRTMISDVVLDSGVTDLDQLVALLCVQAGF